MRKFISFVVMLFVLCLFVSADFDFSKIKDRVSEFTLPNGLKFILIEDHSVPIASFVTYANVGGSDERIGIYDAERRKNSEWYAAHSMGLKERENHDAIEARI